MHCGSRSTSSQRSVKKTNYKSSAGPIPRQQAKGRFGVAATIIIGALAGRVFTKLLFVVFAALGLCFLMHRSSLSYTMLVFRLRLFNLCRPAYSYGLYRHGLYCSGLYSYGPCFYLSKPVCAHVSFHMLSQLALTLTLMPYLEPYLGPNSSHVCRCARLCTA